MHTCAVAAIRSIKRHYCTSDNKFHLKWGNLKWVQESSSAEVNPQSRVCPLIYQNSLGGVSVIHLLFFSLNQIRVFPYLTNTLEFSRCSFVGY